jgi:MFS family permease
VRSDAPGSLWRDRDFLVFWSRQGVSQTGSYVTQVALPVIAVLVLDATPVQVGLLAAAGVVAHAVAALPMGAMVDRLRKRPVMVGADLGRALLLGSLLVTHAAGGITLVHLYMVAVLAGALDLLFRLAAQAHLPDLVAGDRLLEANAKLEGMTWLAVIGGPSLGGLLVAVFGPVRALAVDLVSYLASAASVTLLRRPEPPPHRPARRSIRADVSEGFRFLRGHRTLRRMLLANALLAWTVLFVSPVETLFLLRGLGASPIQYGLAMGIPGLGGFVGVFMVRRLVERYGTHRVMWWAGLARGPWALLAPLAQPGVAGLLLCTVAWTGLLAAASVYNVAQTTYRLQIVPVALRGRVFASWRWVISVGSPIMPIAGGAVATVIGLRWTLVVGGLALCLASLVLDRQPVDQSVTRSETLAGTNPCRA